MAQHGFTSLFGSLRRSGLAFLLLAPAGAASGQVVRGTIVDRASGAPASGVVVSLEAVGPAEALPLASVLSDGRGEFALRAPAAGRFRVNAKRIGVRRFLSDEFELAAGETKRFTFQIDAIAMALPEVLVSGLCVTRPAHLKRVASLWDEARTALAATQISLRDRLFEARVLRYASLIEPRSLRVLNEWRSDAQGAVARPFTSLSGDSLSAMGYWRELPGDSVEYHGPDADVLASNAFVRDHCFSLVEGRRDRPGLTGLAFEPSRSRTLPDIRGTIWLDARTFDLRFVEFGYTRLPAAANSDHIGGEVHFARLPHGAWIVRRWFIRMPQYGDQRSGNWLRTVVRRLHEEGGDVSAPGLSLTTAPAVVTGTVVDSSGTPLGGAGVRIAGTQYAAISDAAGRFRLDSLPPGRFTVIAEQEGYSRLDMIAAGDPVTLSAGATVRVRLRALSAPALTERLCDEPARPDRATLRLAMVDSATRAPFAGVLFLVNWSTDTTRAPPALTSLVRPIRRRTDGRGLATFCAVPANTPLEVSLVGAGRTAQHVMMITLEPGEITLRLVTGRKPASNP
jgi:hypothetical protein